jgi:parallel beta-helix repeat protein
MKSLLSLLAKLDRSNSKKNNRSLLSPFITRSIKLSLHSWLLGISIITAIPIGSIVSEIRPAQAGVIRAFTPRYRRQANGSIRLIGNTNVTCPTNATDCTATQNRTGSSVNDDFLMQNVNTVGGSVGGVAIFNSSSANFTLPANATIKFAGLYWGSKTSGGTAAPNASAKNTVKFKIGTGAYQTITAAPTNIDNATNSEYHAFKDVTSLVDGQGGNTTETYAVADIQARLGGNAYGGWSLIIVYDDPLEPWRELNVFDGFALVDGATTTNISGFYVPPSGLFKAEFGAFVYEGDQNIGGDSLSINGTTIGLTTGGTNRTDNFWDGSVTSLSTITRSPSYGNTLGVDIDLFSLPTTGATAPIKNGDTSASLVFDTNGDQYFPGAFTLAIDSAAISGRVFDDVNYGGGSGRDYTTANASATASGFPLTVASTVANPNTDTIGANGAIVELYDSTGSFVATTTTDAQGRYGFSKNIKIGTYSIRVVNSSVKSVRPGSSTATGLIPVQTFQTDSVIGTATDPITTVTSPISTASPNTNLVGGKDPSKVDAPANTGSQNLSAIAAQSVSKVTVVDNDAVPDTNFGFNFDTIVNTNDIGQGSLRQFITNSNGLTNAKLDQAPNATPATGTTAINPAVGVETSIFMIPDGNAHSGLPAGSPNLLTSGVASIVPITSLPVITDTNTTIDGGTQTVNIGDTKTGSVGYSGSVGTTATTLSGVNNPEVVISNAHTLAAGLSATGNFFTVRGMSIYGFGATSTVNDANILFAGTSQFLVEKSLIGIPSGGSPDTAPISGTFTSNHSGIAVKGAVSNVTIQENIIAQNGGSGLLLNTGAYTILTIQKNESAYNGVNDIANGDGITLTNCTTTCLIQTNYLHDNQAYGLQDQANTSLQVKTNTISKNGLGGTETAGIVVWGSTGTQVTNNIISENKGDGILIARNPTLSAQLLGKTTKISQNSFFSNGKLGIDLAEATTNALLDYSSGQAVTPNNGLVGNTVANNGMDYPVITFSKLTGGSLQVKGFVGNVVTGSGTFNAPILEFFIAANDGNQDGAVVLNDGQTKPHGEGKTYLGSCTATSTGLFNCTFSSAGATGLTDAKNITATATDSSGNTSEFSATPNAAKVILVKRITKIDGLTTNPNDSTKILTAVLDSTATSNDDLGKKWPSGYLKGLVDAGKVKPNNTIEYTIYYLNEGNADASALKICDPIRGSQKYVPGTMKLSVGGAAAIGLSDAISTGDLANTYGAAALPTVVTAPTDCNISATNLTTNLAKDADGNVITNASGNVLSTDNGGVAIQLVGINGTSNLTAIPGATGTVIPPNSYGAFTFTTRVNP